MCKESIGDRIKRFANESNANSDEYIDIISKEIAKIIDTNFTSGTIYIYDSLMFKLEIPIDTIKIPNKQTQLIKYILTVYETELIEKLEKIINENTSVRMRVQYFDFSLNDDALQIVLQELSK